MLKVKLTQRAFTLIELLVVIAIIALLLSILVPSLALVKRKAATAVCLINTKHLSMGWFMYQEENDGNIMSCNDYRYDETGNFVGWVGVPRDKNGDLMGNTQTSPPVTDDDEIRGIEDGVLYDYLESPDGYHCPMDNVRVSRYDKTKIFVTYGVPECLYRVNNSNEQIRKFQEISSPGMRYNFVESAEPRNWNVSHHFVLGSPRVTGSNLWAWWGPMAINHGDSSVLGFCDGHSETRVWRDPFTRERTLKLEDPNVDSYGWGEGFPPADQQSDINYMAAGWAYRHKL